MGRIPLSALVSLDRAVALPSSKPFLYISSGHRNAHGGAVNTIQLLKSLYFLSCSSDGTVKLWTVQHPTALASWTPSARMDSICHVGALRPEGTHFVACSQDGSLFLFDITQPGRQLLAPTLSYQCSFAVATATLSTRSTRLIALAAQDGGGSNTTIRVVRLPGTKAKGSATLDRLVEDPLQ